MEIALLQRKEIRAYVFLTTIVICGLAASLVTAPKVVHFGVNFPFSNIVFSMLTFPIIDCICELWGKRAARQALWFALMSQVLIAIIIQISIFVPHSSYWTLQSEYQLVLSTGINVVIASFIAFAVSQILDILVYQKIKEISNGNLLWLRSNVSTYLGQAIDSIIFVSIVFYNSDNMSNILFGSIIVKICISFLMTPVVYLIVYSVNSYLDEKTLAFKGAYQQ